jgi:hypothetical protein
MNCTQCGTEINLNARFCHNCGTAIQVKNSKSVSDGVRGLKEITGWVYIISNESMPGLVKIGSTKDPKLRAKEFSNAGLPHPYVVEYNILLENPYYVEQETHKRLASKNKSKEWFNCTVKEAVDCIKNVIGGAYVKENLRQTNKKNIDPRIRSKARKILKEKGIAYTIENLIYKIRARDTEIIKLLINAGVDINGKFREKNDDAVSDFDTYFTYTPLIMALLLEDIKTLEFLLDHETCSKIIS